MGVLALSVRSRRALRRDHDPQASRRTFTQPAAGGGRRRSRRQRRLGRGNSAPCRSSSPRSWCLCRLGPSLATSDTCWPSSCRWGAAGALARAAHSFGPPPAQLWCALWWVGACPAAGQSRLCAWRELAPGAREAARQGGRRSAPGTGWRSVSAGAPEALCRPSTIVELALHRLLQTTCSGRLSCARTCSGPPALILEKGGAPGDVVQRGVPEWTSPFTAQAPAAGPGQPGSSAAAGGGGGGAAGTPPLSLSTARAQLYHHPARTTPRCSVSRLQPPCFSARPQAGNEQSTTPAATARTVAQLSPPQGSQR